MEQRVSHHLITTSAEEKVSRCARKFDLQELLYVLFIVEFQVLF